MVNHTFFCMEAADMLISMPVSRQCWLVHSGSSQCPPDAMATLYGLAVSRRSGAPSREWRAKACVYSDSGQTNV